MEPVSASTSGTARCDTSRASANAPATWYPGKPTLGHTGKLTFNMVLLCSYFRCRGKHQDLN